MAQQNRTTLKGYFETGDTPTEAQFIDLIDSNFNPSNDTLDAIPDGTTYKLVTPAEKSTWNGKAAGDHNHTGVYAPVLGADDNYVTDAEKTSIGTIGDKVDKSTYDANTVLAATTDNTPAAVTIGEQTVLGRITSGNIAALTVAQLQTLLFSSALGAEILLGENYGVKYDAALSADGKYSGLVVAGTAGATLAFGDLVYFAAADSRWELADADAASTSGDVTLGICVQAANADGDATTILLQGMVRADAAFPALTVSAQAYVSTTAGDIQTAQPSGTDDVIRVVGWARTADELYFCPDNSYATHV